MIKLLIGGSPCTYWSIAQKNGRETEANGLGWELFKNYLEAKKKFKPDFFLYENNKSAAQAIKDQIKHELNVYDGTLLMEDSGARYIEINSALVSAQNRQRFYVHNCGKVEQPKDRGILLRDILESGESLSTNDKSYCLTTRCCGAIPEDTIKKNRHEMVAEPVCLRYERTEKGKELRKKYEAHEIHHGFNEHRVLQPREDGKTNTISTVLKDNEIAIPIECAELSNEYYHGNKNTAVFGKIECNNTSNNNGQPAQGTRIYNVDCKSKCLDGDSRNYIIDKIENVGKSETVQNAIPKIVEKKGYLPEMFNAYNKAEITDKSPTLSTGSMVTSSCAVNKLEKVMYEYIDYSPNEKSENCASFSPPHGWNEGIIQYDKFPTLTTGSQCRQQNVLIKGYNGESVEKPLSFINQIYEVKDGKITIKGKQYPTKLADGYYIIRKLTVTECCRLQTMPDDYCRAVSNAQAYKGLGNGWTAEVIIHILNGALANVPKDEEIVVLSMYDGIGTGRYCLDKMGFTNVKYYAYEIDKYAIQIAKSNYPDIIEMGDAFAVNNPDWTIGY